MTLAQQLIDGSADGDVAFIAMTIMLVLFVWVLFAIDKINTRSRGGDEKPGPGGPKR